MTDVNVHVHVHTDPGVDYAPRFDTLEEMIMTTKAELETKVDELATAQAEAASDLTRILDELAALVAAGDLTAIGVKVDEAKAVAVAMSAAADAAVADPTDTPEPTP
jgi:peptidoglycan hydrolase CwlO-like protein